MARRARRWWTIWWIWALAAVIGLLLMVVIGALAVMIFAMSVIKSTAAFEGAVARVSAEPAVVAALGEPLEPGLLVMGNINESGTTGTADLSFILNGPDGQASVHFVGTAAGGQWTYTTLEVTLPDGRRLELGEVNSDQ